MTPATLGHHGPRMIKNATIQNFRCFRRVSLTDCRRINIIVGRNASGKTALMEALALALATTQEIALRYRVWRSTPFSAPAGALMSMDVDKKIWSDLFYNFDLTKKISVTLVGDKRHTHRLIGRYDLAKGFTPVAGMQGEAKLMGSPFILEYKSTDRTRPYVARAVPFGVQYIFQGGEIRPAQDMFFAAHQPIDTATMVQQFHNLNSTHLAEPIIAEIRKEFDFIKGIEIGVHAGLTTLMLDVAGSNEKIPTGFVSAGINKILGILIAISALPNGCVFVDEIENGIYYDRYEAMWRSMYKFCISNNVQLFASTHSDECLKALRNVSADFRNEIRFLRTVDGKNGKEIDQFDGDLAFRGQKIGDIR